MTLIATVANSDLPHEETSGRTVALGFAAAVAMWVICYASLMNPGVVAGEALFALVLWCPLAAGFVAGRTITPGEHVMAVAARVGLVAAMLNMLMVGSLLVDPATRQLQPQAGWWIAGNLLATVALAMIGAAAASWRGGAMRGVMSGTAPSVRCSRRGGDWHHRFALITTATVLLLLITGGIVTGKQAGLAVPDWPTSFGHNMLLYPLAEMSGGRYFEHAHRLYGMLVGVTAITLTIILLWRERRSWIKLLGVIFLALVCVQGVLGGTRVTQSSVALAIVHGVFAQVVLATSVALAVCTAPGWRTVLPRLHRAASTDRTVTQILVAALLLQLVLGALYRHLRREWADPPAPLPVLYAHILVAAIVAGLIVFAGGRAWGLHRDHGPVRRFGVALMHLLALQIGLGIAATLLVWSRPPSAAIPGLEVAVTTAHQASGALLLSCATALALWTRRLLVPVESLGLAAQPQLERH